MPKKAWKCCLFKVVIGWSSATMHSVLTKHGHTHLRRYLPDSFPASLSTSAFFLLCICFALSFISPTACVSGNPISQYPGGVFARAQACRCREIAFLCASISDWRLRSGVRPARGRLSLRVRDPGGEWERD